MIARKLSNRFAYHVQSKGQALYATRSVKVVEATPQMMRAQVQGGELYSVDLEFLEGALVVHCSCPYFEDRGACKHIWAGILEADRVGALSEARDSRWLDLDEDFDFAPDLDLSSPWTPPPRAPQLPEWQERISAVQRAKATSVLPSPAWQKDAEILFELDHAASKRAGTFVVQLMYRTQKKSGEWSAVKELRLTPSQAALLPDARDSEVATLLLGAQEHVFYSLPASNTNPRSMSGSLARRLLPLMSATGRLRLRRDARTFPLAWDEGPEWEFVLDVRRDANDLWWMRGQLRRGDDVLPVHQLELIFDSGLFLAEGRISRFRNGGAHAWIEQTSRTSGICFRDSEREDVLQAIVQTGALPRIDADEEMLLQQRMGEPRFGLRVHMESGGVRQSMVSGKLLLDYGAGWLLDGPAQSLWMPEQRTLVHRNQPAEDAARVMLLELGVRAVAGVPPELRIGAKALPGVVRQLLAHGWHIEAEGRAFRKPGEARLDVRSGIDWFELHAEIQYEGTSVKLPALLAALRRGESIVRLDDGTYGLLPEEWLEQVAPLATLGVEEDGHLRFRKNQTTLLDALLASQPAVEYDQAFAAARGKLRTFQGIEAAPQPLGFVGSLRDYQRIGLGWMNFLRELGFGGCLADDMGVGKTAQVLALLENRRTEGAGASLVVAPKSLMFNWKDEAERFTPGLKVLLHTGTERSADRIGEANLVLTTYGTLLRDAVHLAQVPFDYVVLDEAQAIKNASTASSKAVRVLKARHRLALSGTPVENHLGELWSLFEFLNPGMLGESKVLRIAGGLAQDPGEEARRLLAQALRPFILRRTKQQVARELPAKTEQTIYCELEPAQRKLYDELKRHYRDKLLGKTDAKSWSKSKLQVLEALLRLRQASCHPGLLDEKKRNQPSAKLEVLFDQLSEICQEGHKALVFSQFTSLLSIVRERLDADKTPYEYLDGQTRDRQARVQRFQQDPDCPIFLISLKAGGLGLNLTAAEYVFLLDPWWNPAVEAQAIDRAHRIGQTRNVFAYRLIAKDTVEEKVLELQKSKRELADAILGEDNAVLRDLKPDDLDLLLS